MSDLNNEDSSNPFKKRFPTSGEKCPILIMKIPSVF